MTGGRDGLAWTERFEAMERWLREVEARDRSAGELDDDLAEGSARRTFGAAS